MDTISRDRIGCITFSLNGQEQRVSGVSADTSLNTYIRDHARLKGTKFMCKEGGCGACVVSLEFTHPVTGQQRIVSVNSCLYPVYACQGKKVLTVEGIGNRTKGYHKVQSRLAHFYGTQCGYCSPGWVMAMYSLLEAKPKATMAEIESSLGGNLCRCTGYRPILDAFKSFASDKSKDLEQKVTDIEDLLQGCPKNGTISNVKSDDINSSKTLKTNKIFDHLAKDLVKRLPEKHVRFHPEKTSLQGDTGWYRVSQVDEIFEIFEVLKGSYMLVGGNTAKGVLREQSTPDVYIDINNVSFLKSFSFYSGQLYIGANTTLTDAIELLKNVAVENKNFFKYTNEMALHLEKVANTAVRNVGTLAGNLMIKHRWRKFQSDVFLILETVGALVSVRGSREAVSLMSLEEFLDTDMYKQVILQIVLPPLDAETHIVKFSKIAPRAQNAVAYVNAGFKLRLDKQDRFRVVERPSIVYGGIHPNFTHASKTESYLSGTKLLGVTTLFSALTILGKEINPDNIPPDSSPEYRRQLAQALFYRMVLSLDPHVMISRFRSGGEDIARPLSSGRQEFDQDSTRPPLYKPYPKVDSIQQCSGEAQYVYDLPTAGRDLHAAFVLSSCGPAVLDGLDPSAALKLRGVVAFFSAEDIPGVNTFTPTHDFIPDKEELFASKNILYAGQPVGMIVAETQEWADSAAHLVNISYASKKKPVLDVQEVVESNDAERIFLREERNATNPTENVMKVVKGEFKMDTQYHFPMETLTCVSVPTEDGGLDVFCTTQWLQAVQETVSLVLNMPENKINVKVGRLGGGFGVKLTRASLVAAACSLAAHLLQRPVRMVLSLKVMMEAIGKRWPCYFNYEAGVDDEGEIQYLKSNLYADAGSSFNDFVIAFSVIAFTSVYDASKWSTRMFDVKTDKASTVWTRAPGTLEAITMAETILEHIAYDLKKDPLDVRMKNVDKKYPIEDMIKTLKEKSEYDKRKIDVGKFNKENLWKKRGLSVALMRFPMDTLANYHAMVSVYRGDGSVSVVHGGVEVGQGINTKVAQVCASSLGLTLEEVVVKPTSVLICPNDGLTGGSFTTDSVCYAVEQCCIELKKRLEPVRQSLKEPTWLKLVQAAYAEQIDLNVTYMFSPKTDIKSYQIFGAVVMEVEVDILTGEHRVVRADVLEDAGKSLNPYLDVGQVEGAFVMGLGYFTSEEVVYSPDTGQVLTTSSLHYKVPGAKDIPTDFRVYILKNADNPLGVLRSKAVGEPPLCLSVAILFAIRQAIREARRDLGLPDLWLSMDAPLTAEKICLSSGIRVDNYLI